MVTLCLSARGLEGDTIMRIVRSQHGYHVETDSYTYPDLRRDLPEEAGAAKSDIENCWGAEFAVQEVGSLVDRSNDRLIAWSTPGGSGTYRWYYYDRSAKKWVQFTP